MPVGLDPLERELAEIDAEVDQIRSGMHKKFGMFPIIILLSVLVTFSGLLWYTYSVGVRAGSEEATRRVPLRRCEATRAATAAAARALRWCAAFRQSPFRNKACPRRRSARSR